MNTGWIPGGTLAHTARAEDLRMNSRRSAAAAVMAAVLALSACAASVDPLASAEPTSSPPLTEWWQDLPPLAESPESSFDPIAFARQPYLFDGDLWLFDSLKAEVVRVDPASGTVVARIVAGEAHRSPGDVNGLAELDGIIWSGRNATGGLTGIDPSTNAVVAQHSSAFRPYELAAGDGVLWATDFEGGAVASIDPRTGAVITEVALDHPTGIALTPGFVWVARHRSTLVSVVSQETGQVVGKPIVVGGRPENVIAAYGAVWVALNTGKGVARIDPRTREVTTVALEAPVYAVSAADGAIWAGTGPHTGCGNDSYVVRIDPEQMAVTGHIPVPCSFWATVIDGLVYAPDDETGEVFRFRLAAK